MDEVRSLNWGQILSAPRRSAETIPLSSIPAAPGVYAWFKDDDCVYVGKASDLRSRLRTHLATSLDLSRSTLRSWVAVRELGLPREFTRQRPSVMRAEQVAVVNRWLRSCDVGWVVTQTKDQAVSLESQLLASWRPPINVA